VSLLASTTLSYIKVYLSLPPQPYLPPPLAVDFRAVFGTIGLGLLELDDFLLVAIVFFFLV
jgi:hypothetical protein